MRLSHRIAFAATLVATSAVAAPRLAAQAQTSGTRFGAEAAYADHFDLGVGAFVKFHLADMDAHPITGRVSFDWYFPGSYGDAPYDMRCLRQRVLRVGVRGTTSRSRRMGCTTSRRSGNAKPYVGAGLEYAKFSYGNGYGCDVGCGGIGLNILGGLNFMANSRLMPFVELKLGLAGSVGGYGGTVLTIKGGIHLK